MGFPRVPNCVLCDKIILTVICSGCRRKHVTACLEDFSLQKARLFNRHFRGRVNDEAEEPFELNCIYCGKLENLFVCENCFEKAVQEWVQWHAPKTMENVAKLFC
ncbi:MAG: hypothetical protein GOU97_01045 [Nanoarchaeota archaeon]|nr:hypothetical protein [Nanoarchaeota archaeon]